MADQNYSDPIALKCPQCGGNLPAGCGETIVCPYCGSSLIFKRHSPQATASETAIHGLHLKPLVCTDVQDTGLPVFKMLVPTDWEFHGGCQWHLDNPGLPAVVTFQITNPQGAEAFEVLPNINFTWNNNPMKRMFTASGTRQFGAEVCPPCHISGYGHAWANDLGEYILTDDSFFDPNLASTQHWEQLFTDH